jgi:hypothetical protein
MSRIEAGFLVLLWALSCIVATPAAAAELGAHGAALDAVGEGPVGHDNGERYPCTGLQAGAQAVICIRVGAPAGGNGSAAAPLQSINAAIAAAKAGDVLQVAAGTYAENVALGAFNAPSSTHLRLLGGFSADFSQRDANAQRSIIDGGLLNPAVQLHLQTAQRCVLDGFEITGGLGLGSSWQDGYGHGGGVYAVLEGNGEIVISHNRIHGNRTRDHTSIDSRGGGIHTRNQSGGAGTGLLRIEDNHIRDNLAGKGAGINVSGRQARVLRNAVQGNTGHNDHGGGIYVSSAATEVRANVISGNVVGASVGYGWGGGILIAGAGADLVGNLITDNYAPTAGAGVFWDEGAVGTMRNDLVVRNRCPEGARSGAALYIDGGPGGPSRLALDALTIADHVCPGTAPNGAAIYIEASSTLSVRNTVLWGNSREFATLSGGSYTIAYSLTGAAGTGNFSADPRFADAANLDYHLRSRGGRYTAAGWVLDALSSPAIDAGDPAADFSAESLPNGGRMNIGAYANTAQASRSAATDPDHLFGNGFE